MHENYIPFAFFFMSKNVFCHWRLGTSKNKFTQNYVHSQLVLEDDKTNLSICYHIEIRVKEIIVSRLKIVNGIYLGRSVE